MGKDETADDYKEADVALHSCIPEVFASVTLKEVTLQTDHDDIRIPSAMGYISVQNGYPGAKLWVTIYMYDGLSRSIVNSGALNTPGTAEFEAPSAGNSLYKFYVRCETFAPINGTDVKFSDTTAEALPSDDEAHPYQCTLLPASDPTGTYIAAGNTTGNAQMALSGNNTYTAYLMQAGFGSGTKNGYLSVDPNNANQCAVVTKTDAAPPSSMLWQKLDAQWGSIFINIQTPQTLLYAVDRNGAHAQLIPNTPLNQRLALWTIAGNFPNKVAIRPMADSSQNLNVFGGGPYNSGNPVGTWSWGGGAGNEVWSFIPAVEGGLQF
ncbi:hypothetical protein MBLNU457_g0048t1 [Dothideomycetes sp. NU457]